MTIDSTLLNQVLARAKHLLDRLESPQAVAHTHQLSHEHMAFRWEKSKGFIAVDWQCPISQNQLLHVDRQAKLLLENTQQFVASLPANNALLWGSRGTGKSSLIQAVLNSFTKEQLQIIEISYRDFSDWIEIIESIRAHPTKKFIIFCDDLSFNEGDASYREVKAALEGSLISLPENTLIYASSNRRHLLPEKLADNSHAQHINGEIHHAEAVEETISLSDRFGLWLSFHALTQDQYLDIVQHWLEQFGLKLKTEQYQELALRWALERGSRSGRIANQFARDFAGKYQLQMINKKD